MLNTYIEKEEYPIVKRKIIRLGKRRTKTGESTARILYKHRRRPVKSEER